MQPEENYEFSSVRKWKMVPEEKSNNTIVTKWNRKHKQVPETLQRKLKIEQMNPIKNHGTR